MPTHWCLLKSRLKTTRCGVCKLKSMKKLLMMGAIWLTGSMAGQAQEAESFSIATLNVDGLPQKILVAKVNPDGPGGGGNVRIGRYLQKRGYDMVFMQEDFNHHEELTVPLEDDYQTHALGGVNVHYDQWGW